MENNSEKYEPHMIPKWGNSARYHDMIIRASFVDDTYYIKLRQRNWTTYEWHSFLDCLMPRNKSHLVEGESLYIEFTKLDHAFSYKKRIKDALGWDLPQNSLNGQYEVVMRDVENLSEDDYVDFCYHWGIEPDDMDELSSFVMKNKDSPDVQSWITGRLMGFDAESVVEEPITEEEE